MLGDLALVEDDMLLGVDAGGDESRGDLADARFQLYRVLRDRDGVQIDDAIDAVMRALQFDEFDDRAEIIAKVQISGRLHAGKNPFGEFCHNRVSWRLTFFLAALRYRKLLRRRQAKGATSRISMR